MHAIDSNNDNSTTYFPEDLFLQAKSTFLLGKSSNGQKAHEKMLITTGHKRNANQNHTKIPPHFF
jgi:hypothetical protein